MTVGKIGMKYLGYLLLIVAGVAGFYRVTPFVLIGLALASTLIFATARRHNLKSTPMAPDQNMLLDGAFLLFSQILIMFMFYLIGYFCTTPAGEMFGRFLQGGN
ncbi:hypothetical protein ACJ3XI_06010 [Litorimonas sp. RW-G-Af-16]|uniref:hypothetical protein n=1 Tax=Litorimonas sp. RW-G-Af-16 TaxID=3241168 RepID=UPI00390C713F